MNMNNEVKKPLDEKKSKETSFIALGISLGLIFGAAVKNIALGLAIGVAIGASLDSNKKGKS